MKNSESVNYYNTAQILKNNGDFSSALEALESALRISPDFFEARVNCSEANRILGNTAQAIENMNVALTLKPDFFEGHNAIGLLYHSISSFDHAIGHFKKAVSINPEFAEAFYNLGNCHRDTENFDESIAGFKAAIALNPHFFQAIANCGEAMQITGMIDQAEEYFKKALDINPSSDIVISNLLLTQNYNPGYSQLQLFENHKKYAALIAHRNDKFPPILKKMCTADKKLRIGYVSGDFRNHPASYFLTPLFSYCNHEDFRIYCYSNTQVPDAKTVFFRDRSDSWNSIRDMTDREAAEKIRKDGIDILVDLCGHSADNRLGIFCFKPSPVQVTYLGYPNSTGLTVMDYRLTDNICDPEGQQSFYTEALRYLPHCFCNYAPQERIQASSEPPVKRNNFITFGSTHTLARLNNQVLDLWANILERIPSSRLRIVRNTLKGNAAKRIRDRFIGQGITADRISLVHDIPPNAHLDIYTEIDVLLDTFPWSGHTSACEALFMGVPVISLHGERYAGNMVNSVLSNIGLPEYIAQSKEEYILKAERAATDSSSLIDLRSTLRRKMLESPLCDSKTFVKNIESAYRSMWEAYCNAL